MKHHQNQVQVSYYRTKEKCRIQETKNLSNNSDISTDTKKILLVRQNLQKKTFFFCAAMLHPLWAKVVNSDTPSFHYFFPKDSKNLKNLDIGLRQLTTAFKNFRLKVLTLNASKCRHWINCIQTRNWALMK